MGHDDDDLPAQLVLFDGTCGLCDRSVQWILDRDPAKRFHFAPLEGPTARRIRARHPEVPTDLDSLVLVTRGEGGERLRWESQAVFGICEQLPGPIAWLRGFAWLPRPLADGAYRLVARLRYRIWGRLESCRIPDPAVADRFLE